MAKQHVWHFATFRLHKHIGANEIIYINTHLIPSLQKPFELSIIEMKEKNIVNQDVDFMFSFFYRKYKQLCKLPTFQPNFINGKNYFETSFQRKKTHSDLKMK